MKALLLPTFLVCCSSFAFAQTQSPAASTPQPANYANYSIMLVNPVPGSGAVVLMHTPNNGLEFVPVNNTKEALSAGYVAVRAAELGEFISALKEENTRLAAENTRLQSQSPIKASSEPAASLPPQADLEAQRRAQAAAEKAARRQQMIQTWLMLQNVNRPQNLNVNVTDCNRSPALCVGR